jgi:copper chaperone
MQSRFKVSDISCEHCAKRVTDAILAADASARVDVDIERQTVVVEASLAAEAVERLLAGAGYPAEPA